MIGRAAVWLRRKRNSLQFGVPFQASRDIRVPEILDVNGKTVSVQHPDEHGVYADFSTVFLDDCYGLLSIDFDAESPCVLDVGANIGLFSLAVRTLYGTATVHAYEPTPELEKYVGHHADQADFSYFGEAVGAHDGTVSLKREGDSNLTQVVHEEGGIPMVSLQTAVDRIGGSVDLLKLDCEGGEWALFEKEESWNSIRNVVMEYHLWAQEGETHASVKDKLNELGYEVVEQRCDPSADFGNLWASRR